MTEPGARRALEQALVHKPQRERFTWSVASIIVSGIFVRIQHEQPKEPPCIYSGNNRPTPTN